MDSHSWHLWCIPPSKRWRMPDQILISVTAWRSRILTKRCFIQRSRILFRTEQLKFVRVTEGSLKIVLLWREINRKEKDLKVGKIESRGPRREREFLEVDLATATLVGVATRLGMSKSSKATKGLGLGKSPKVGLEELTSLIPGELIASCLNLKMIRISLSETKCLLVV